jgi:putative zinc finger/helix-turn-helix YgiT family protein
MTRYCPQCDAEVPVREIASQDTLRVRGEPIRVPASVLQCSVCKTFLSDPERDEQVLQRAYAEYRTRHGLLTPEAIRGFRERYHLSQRALARLLGWGLVTIQRYESGALQDLAHDEELRRLNDPRWILHLLEQHPDRLSNEERARLRATILADAPAESPRIIAQAIEDAITLDAARDPLGHGFRRCSMERLSLIVGWLAQAGERPFKTKLAKLLWLADFATFRLHQVSLTGLAYARLPYGPVPDQYSLVLAALEAIGTIAIVTDEVGDVQGERIVPRIAVDLQDFTPPERRVLEWVAHTFGAASASELSRLSHAEPVWRKHADGERIAYSEADTVRLLNTLPT